MSLKKYPYNKINDYDLLKEKILLKNNFKHKQILDVGFSRVPLRHLKPNLITVIDNDNQKINKAKHQQYNTLLSNMNYFSFNKLKTKFDIILLYDILEHLINPNSTLKSLLNNLKKGGKIIISMPNSYNIVNRFYFLKGKSTDITDNNHFKNKNFSDHLHQINQNKIINLFNNNNLKIIKKYYYFPKSIQKHKNLKLFEIILKIIRLFKIDILFPNLFSYAFIFIGEKKC